MKYFSLKCWEKLVLGLSTEAFFHRHDSHVWFFFGQLLNQSLDAWALLFLGPGPQTGRTRSNLSSGSAWLPFALCFELAVSALATKQRFYWQNFSDMLGWMCFQCLALAVHLSWLSTLFSAELHAGKTWSFTSTDLARCVHSCLNCTQWIRLLACHAPIQQLRVLSCSYFVVFGSVMCPILLSYKLSVKWVLKCPETSRKLKYFILKAGIDSVYLFWRTYRVWHFNFNFWAMYTAVNGF